MHGLAVYVKQVLVFACDLSLGVSKDSYLVMFLMALLHLVSYVFSSINHSPLVCAQILELFHLT